MKQKNHCNEHHHHDYVEKINDELKEFNKFIEMSEIFKVFGDPTRLKILFSLFNKELFEQYKKILY